MTESPTHSMRALPRSLRRLALALLMVAAPGGLLTACGSQSDPVEAPPTASPSPDLAQVVTPIFTVPPTDTPLPTATSTVPPTPEFIDGIPTSSEQQATIALLQNEQGVYGDVVLGPNDRLIVTRNAHLPFVTASTYKLVLMADILSKVETGELSLQQTYPLDPQLFVEGGGDMYFSNDEAGTQAKLSDLLFAAGAFSSNVAGLTMLKLTTPESLRQTAERIGMNDTWIQVDPTTLPIWPPQPAVDTSQADVDAARAYIEAAAALGPVNITTPFDMATYMQKLATNSLISPFVSEQIRNILEEQLIRDRIPLLLPSGYNAIDKPGNLEDVVNDVGIITLPSGEDRAVALLSMGVDDDDRATQVEQRLALIAAGITNVPLYDDSVEATPAP